MLVNSETSNELILHEKSSGLLHRYYYSHIDDKYNKEQLSTENIPSVKSDAILEGSDE